MKLQGLLDELKQQQPLKWDQRISASQVAMQINENHLQLQLNGNGNGYHHYEITQPCHSQIAEKLEIPLKYYHKMMDDEPDLLTENVNTWLHRTGKEVFVRGLGETARAFLSDRYRVIDHLDVLYCSLNELQAHDTEIESCYLSETEMNLKVKSNQLRDFVRHRDDLILGGLLLTNSETGQKALKVEPRLYRVQCTNGMVIEDLVTRKVHLGNNGDASDELVYLSIRQSIRELFSQFGNIITTLRESTEIKVINPQRVIHNVVTQYQLSEAQKENILIAFGAEPEQDQYGIANAITRAAQSEPDWEKSLELERIGGKVAILPMQTFKSMDGN